MVQGLSEADVVVHSMPQHVTHPLPTLFSENLTDTVVDGICVPIDEELSVLLPRWGANDGNEADVLCNMCVIQRAPPR